jgi:hypothetical protein
MVLLIAVTALLSAGCTLLLPLLLLVLSVALGALRNGLRFHSVAADNDPDKYQLLRRRLGKGARLSSATLYRQSELLRGGLLGGWTDTGRFFAALVPWTGCSNEDGSDNGEVWVLCAADAFADMIRSDTELAHARQSDCKLLTLWMRQGGFTWFNWTKHDVALALQPLPHQEALMDEIQVCFRAHGRCKAFVEGPPGQGKTSLGLLLAARLGGTACMEHCPTDPGDRLHGLYERVQPTAACPLVVILDEADCLIERAHVQATVAHKQTPTPVRDKSTLNKYMDDIDLVYPHVVVLCLSNRSKAYLDGLDPSYLRPGRFHLCARLCRDDASAPRPPSPRTPSPSRASS